MCVYIHTHICYICVHVCLHIYMYIYVHIDIHIFAIVNVG